MLAVLLALPLVAALTSLDVLLRALGYDAALGRYLRAIAWGGPAFLGFAARRAGFVALALGIGFMGTAAVMLWTAPEDKELHCA